MKTYIGIDPGVSGGIAAIYEGEGAHVRAWKMPETERDLWDVFCELANPTFLILENVGPMPSMGKANLFTFGRSVGLLRGMIIASRIPFEAVTATTWQSYMRCKPGGKRDVKENNKLKKKITKAKAQELFPNIKCTNYIADALLIAEYCRRVRSEA